MTHFVKTKLQDSAASIKLKALIKTAILEASSLWTASGLYKKSTMHGVIFTLHHVRPSQPGSNPSQKNLEITPDFLDLVISTLRDLGYRFIRLEELETAAKDPSAQPFAVFTLDDGYRDNVTHALPVFARHQVPFTIFACSGFIQRTHSMWWETAFELTQQGHSLQFDFGDGREQVSLASPDAREAAYQRLSRFIMNSDEAKAIDKLNQAASDCGIDPMKPVDETILDEAELIALSRHPLATIGAHSVSHRAMARLTHNELTEELTSSRHYLETLLSQEICTFAFPYGHRAEAGPREFAAAGASGFKLAVTTVQAPVCNEEVTSALQLPRVNIDGRWQRRRYVAALASGLPFRALGTFANSR
jgi:peptidoglycan/xylan/chitin deacetylase (PgdA/CDA1 family)